MKHQATLGVAAMAFLLSGCGGGGGGDRTSNARAFSVPIVWAERTRALEGPASASSVTVLLTGASATGRDVSAFGERGEGAAARTTHAVSTGGALPGTYPMTVRFTTGAGGSGDVVATASATVRVGDDGSLRNPDGTPLSGVTNFSTVAAVEIAPGQTIPVLQIRPVTVSVRNATGDLIAVPEGAIRIAVASGNGAQVVDGRLKGIAEGGVNVTASVDGVTSEGTNVVVARKAAAVQSIKMGVTGLTYLPLVSRLYVGVGPTIDGYGEEVLTVNPENAAVGPRVAAGTAVQSVTVASDGSRAYAVTDNYTKIRGINLQTDAALGEIVPGAEISSIAISPTDPTMLAVTTSTGGLSLYRDGVKLATPVGVENISGPIVFNASGTAVYAMRTTGVVRVETTTTGLGAVTSASVVGKPVAVRGNRVYLADGGILDATTLASVGALPLQAEGVPIVDPVAISPSGTRAFVLTGSALLPGLPSTVLVYDTTTLQKIEEYAITIPTGPWLSLTATGEHSIAFTSTRDPSLILATLNWP